MLAQGQDERINRTMSLHLKEAKLNELQAAVQKLEDEINQVKEKWKANDDIWRKLTDLDEYLKYKGYIKATAGTSSKLAPEKLAARNKKKQMSDKEKIAHVKAYDEAKKKRQGAKYLKGNDLNSNNITSWRAAFLAALEATEAASDKP